MFDVQASYVDAHVAYVHTPKSTKQQSHKRVSGTSDSELLKVV